MLVCIQYSDPFPDYDTDQDSSLPRVKEVVEEEDEEEDDNRKVRSARITLVTSWCWIHELTVARKIPINWPSSIQNSACAGKNQRCKRMLGCKPLPWWKRTFGHNLEGEYHTWSCSCNKLFGWSLAVGLRCVLLVGQISTFWVKRICCVLRNLQGRLVGDHNTLKFAMLCEYSKHGL